MYEGKKYSNVQTENENKNNFRLSFWRFTRKHLERRESRKQRQPISGKLVFLVQYLLFKTVDSA